MQAENSSRDELVLVLAPSGRDTPLTCAILEDRAGVKCQPCADVNDLCKLIAEGAGVVIIAEEALDPASARRLTDTLAAQLPWSDVPVLVLGTSEDITKSGVQISALRQRGNITVIDRPLRIVTLVSAVHSALRARRRQYEVRDLLAQTRAAVRQRDQFLAMLGHELRNPLATISTAMSVVDAAAPTKDGMELEHRDIIRRQTKHLARLVDDLLDVSRITSGKVALQRRPVDLCKLAQSAVKAVESVAREQNHEVNLELCEGPVNIEADPVRIEQVINNLLTNAIKYTPAGGRITLRVDIVDCHADLRVRDNGIGISPELLPRVFDLFAQADRSLDRSQGGMGIGLTLVRSLVEMHGGDVVAKSNGPGSGSEFVVTLPLIEVPQAREQPAKPSRPPGGRRVLIVEDNREMRRAMQCLLQVWGYRVELAEDGPRGVSVATSAKPDIAFVDIGLPGLNGYEVARKIRSTLGSEIRLIALTGYGQPEDREEAHAAGFDLHLTKPVDPEQLAKILAEASTEAQHA